MDKRYGFEDTSFRAAGGEEGLRRLVDSFYLAMDTLPEAKTIREMHATDLTVVKDKLTRFLCGWLGGPRLFHEKYGPIFLPKAHAPFPIGLAERNAWMLCMLQAVEAQPYDPDFKRYLLEAFLVPAGRVMNRE